MRVFVVLILVLTSSLAHGQDPQVKVSDAFKVRKEGVGLSYATSQESFEPMVRALAREVAKAKESQRVGEGASASV
jgi:hypothetical protein